MEVTRKLVSIRKINNKLPIEGADFIECVVVDGWELVAKKGEFQINDLCVYFEIDSFIPEDARYSFLKDIREHQGRKGYRIKTIKLRKQISQGLALPVSLFPELSNYIEGDEVTQALNVIKYDNSTNISAGGVKIGKAFGKFPSFIPKTDEERIQNLTSWFERYKDDEWEESLKLDGSSCTMYKIKKDITIFDKIKKLFGFKVQLSHFGVCSRNIELKNNNQYNKLFQNNEKELEFNTSDFWSVAIKYSVEDKIPEGYAVQGELIGPKIQANHEKVQNLEYYIFNVYNIKENKYLTPDERKEFVTKYDLPHVPVLGFVKIFQECKNVHELLDRVRGESMNKGTVSEGRVFKLKNGTRSFKCINNEYLLKCEK